MNDLEKQEELLGKGLAMVGAAIREIFENNLWQQGEYTSFADWCKRNPVQSMSYRRAKQFMDAHIILENIKEVVADQPTEYALRPLTGLPAQTQAALWQIAVKTSPNGHVTHRHVKAVVTTAQSVEQTGTIIIGGDQYTTEQLKPQIIEEHFETMQRQIEHINERNKPKQEQDIKSRNDLWEFFFKLPKEFTGKIRIGEKRVVIVVDAAISLG